MYSQESQALMEAAVDAVVVIDHRGLMAGVNQATGRLFGYRDDELLGRNVNLLMPEPHHSAHNGYLRHYLVTGEQRVIGAGRSWPTKDGSGFRAFRVGYRQLDTRFVPAAESARSTARAALKLESDRANASLELNCQPVRLDPARSCSRSTPRQQCGRAQRKFWLHGWISCGRTDAHSAKLLATA